MIVVPTLAKREQRNPEAVSGVISSKKPPSAPHMGGGVDQPRGVKPDYSAKADAPENITPSAQGKKQTGQYSDRHPVPTADPHLKSVFAKLGNIAQKLC